MLSSSRPRAHIFFRRLRCDLHLLRIVIAAQQTLSLSPNLRSLIQIFYPCPLPTPPLLLSIPWARKWKNTYLWVIYFVFSSCGGLHLCLLGAVVYLTLLEKAPLKTFEVQTEYLDYCTRNIQSFGSSLICVVSDIDDTRNICFKLARQWRATYLWVVYFVLSWRRFAHGTVGRSCLPNAVGDGTVEKSWGANWIPILLYKEYTTFWFEFDLCG